jgi:hypothetical protein
VVAVTNDFRSSDSAIASIVTKLFTTGEQR